MCGICAPFVCEAPLVTFCAYSATSFVWPLHGKFVSAFVHSLYVILTFQPIYSRIYLPFVIIIVMLVSAKYLS
jgi:hypothetical protein